MARITVTVGTLIIALAVSMLVGSSGTGIPSHKVAELRAARTLLGCGVGASLALSGAVMQTLLGNPLATPYTLGVASAAAFGAFLAQAAGVASLAGSTPWAFFAALAELAILFSIAGRQRWRGNTLILAGVTLSFFFGASATAVKVMSDPFKLAGMERWLLGSISSCGATKPIVLVLLSLPAATLILSRHIVMDHIAVDATLAYSRGVHVARERIMLLGAASWLAACAVAAAGPIAFVGLVVPHVSRRILGPRHASTLAGSLAIGPAFLLLSDTASRILPAPVPVGMVTALVGAPFFIAILSRH